MNQLPASRTVEDIRLAESVQRTANWHRWGPYLSERQWGTVREDYSENQDAWSFFPHDHARSRSFRWGEDGLMGICDREGRLCFAFAFWNGQDPILKERLFGVSGPEGSHGEDVKECYYYLESTPTHSYMKGLYKYPQKRFPYEMLSEINRHRSRNESEFELLDSEIFNESRYFDCVIEYAKNTPDDVLIRLTVINHGPDAADLHIVPQWWFRNTWIWGCDHEGCFPKPRVSRKPDGSIVAEHQTLGSFVLAADATPDGEIPVWMFAENETNPHRHPGWPTTGNYYKDAFNEYIVQGNEKAIDPRETGTKCGAHYALSVAPGEQVQLRFRMCSLDQQPENFFGPDFDQIFEERIKDGDEFYATRIEPELPEEMREVMRQAYAGLLWTKQFYHYIVEAWLEGDPNMPPPPQSRKQGRNADWPHLFNRDIISMPDKWEYPWYAAWDLAFHMVPMARLDSNFAKEQLILFLREWYMHPNGQIPAYEWALSDVNPPVHAWACWHVYQSSGEHGEPKDRDFLERVFQKLMLNFTWWVNRKDIRGKHIFSGGFLGLDNIGVFDRSKPLPTGGYLDQADATAWMAFYCGGMLQMALELAKTNRAYGDIASKFFEHYMAIAEAMNSLHGTGLWDDEDGFYYDHLYVSGKGTPMRIRSMVGLIPLCTPVILYEEVISQLPGFRKRMEWFLSHRDESASDMTYLERVCPHTADFGMRLLAIPSFDRLRRMLKYMLDENEFLSPYGIRSLSAVHRQHPFVFEYGGSKQEVRYVPGESDSYMFGGNSNWRGPVWFPVNYLIIESLRKYHEFYGDSLRIEYPTGSGIELTMKQIADELEQRLISIFLPDETGQRPCHGSDKIYQGSEDWKDLILFYEYFHGDNGKGLGASHQTGWTALVATMLENQASRSRSGSLPIRD